MITAIIIILALWGLLALGVTVYTMLTAEEGYEDEAGFHPRKTHEQDLQRPKIRGESPRAEMLRESDSTRPSPRAPAGWSEAGSTRQPRAGRDFHRLGPR